jgi:two-component system sensor histidine kinase ChiS
VTAVLVLDDDCDNRDLLGIILGRAGYQVLTAADTAAARLLLATERVDGLLLDVRLHAESGLDLCRELREDYTTALLPIMMVTAYGTAADVAAGFVAGADDYLVKPYRRAELLSRLGVLLAGRGVLLAGPGALAGAAMPAGHGGELAHNELAHSA